MWTENGKAQVELDAIARCGHTCLALSFFERSVQSVKAFGAQFILDAQKSTFKVYGGFYGRFEKGSFDSYYSKIAGTKDRFYHGLIINRDVGERIFLCPDGEEGRAVYEYLMKNSIWPLIPQWGDALCKEAEKGHLINRMKVDVKYGEYCKSGPMDALKGMTAVIFEEGICGAVPTLLGKLLKSGSIFLPGGLRQVPLRLTDMDTYFDEYGHYLVENLEKRMNPRLPLKGDIENCALKSMRLYPQQIATVNGAVATMTGKKRSGASDYCIINGGMGTGKTIMGLSILEKYFVDKWLRENPSKCWADAYEKPDTICYRAIITAPGHLVEKWAFEAREQIPFAKVEILTEFKQLLSLREKGRGRRGREIYVMSKDFAKLSYSTKPVPYIRKHGDVRRKYCISCGESFLTPGPKCPSCSHTGYRLEKTFRDGTSKLLDEDILYSAKGLSCPCCGRVAVPYKTLTPPTEGDPGQVLDVLDFSNPTTTNQKCWYCGFEFWEPDVKPVDITKPDFITKPKTDQISIFGMEWKEDGEKEALDSEKTIYHDIGRRHSAKWKRISIYANEKQDSTKSVWRLGRYSEREIEDSLRERDEGLGVRKYSPALFIKKYLKGYLDFYIADEFHIYKNTSGQGEAFAALSKASGKTLAMTGTLTGGKAEDLFYSFFRLDPTRMLKAGFTYGDTMKFSYRYGNVRTTSFFSEGEDEEAEKSISTRGRIVKSTRKVEPGISPVLFVDFLLDRTLYLDLSDMTCHLPKLKETVIEVPFSKEEDELKKAYLDTMDSLKIAIKEDSNSNFGLMGSLLQFSQSWLDRPYTENTRYFISPMTGEAVCEYPQMDEFRDPARLTSKEKALIQNVKSDLDSARNCFIYATYTGKPDTNVTIRLKEILERELKERVEILRSDSPQPYEREKYIHRLAEEGVRVIITNPKNVETGLDFIWWKDGIEYNYPSIHCYQLNFELACVQQAIHRHLRLIQPRQCTTFFYCWKDTAQAKLLRILAKKMQAAQAIQGHFSTEGLLSMAEGIDARVELARTLAEKDTGSGADLQSMFDVMEADRTKEGSEKGRWQKMKLLKEIIGKEKEVKDVSLGCDDKTDDPGNVIISETTVDLPPEGGLYSPFSVAEDAGERFDLFNFN